MTGELVQTTTGDHLILHGFYCAAIKSTNTCIIHIHGAYGNFYEATFLPPIAKQYTQNGFAFLSVNTRGHDYIAEHKQQKHNNHTSVIIGGVREVFQDGELDIEAWISYALSLGHTHVIIQGHSLGAMKAVYYYSRHADTVNGLILLSAPDNFGYQRAEYDHRFLKDIEEAKKMVATTPSALMPADSYPTPITAASYLSLFGNAEETGMFTFSDRMQMKKAGIANINCPLLASFAEKDDILVTTPKACIEAIRNALQDPTLLTAFVMEGANHFYHGKEKELAIKLTGWLKGYFPSTF